MNMIPDIAILINLSWISIPKKEINADSIAKMRIRANPL